MKPAWFELGVALTVLLLGGCAEPSAQQRLLLESDQEGIHVVGTAIARAAPDVALVEVGHAASADCHHRNRAVLPNGSQI